MKIKSLFPAFLIIISVFGIIVLQNRVFAYQKNVFDVLENNPLFVPDANKIKNISFGFDNLVTDLIWLKTVQYIGGNARTGEYPLLYDYLNTITDLDPQFYLPYFVGAVLLPESNNAKQAVRLSEKGVQNMPQKWEIPFYLGYIYYFYLEDYAQGAKYYEQASKLPGVLPIAERMAGNLKSKQGKHKIALEMWIDIFETTENEAIKNLEGATGGGHEDAVGAQINVEDIEKFREKLLELVE